MHCLGTLYQQHPTKMYPQEVKCHTGRNVSPVSTRDCTVSARSPQQDSKPVVNRNSPLQTRCRARERRDRALLFHHKNDAPHEPNERLLQRPAPSNCSIHAPITIRLFILFLGSAASFSRKTPTTVPQHLLWSPKEIRTTKRSKPPVSGGTCTPGEREPPAEHYQGQQG